MTLHIDVNSVINDVQEQFHNSFPDLKLEFFFSTKEKLNASYHLHHCFPYVSIGELCNCNGRTGLDIHDTMTITELEEEFRERFGLPAMIYIKSGDYWLKNTSIGKWTLKH